MNKKKAIIISVSIAVAAWLIVFIFISKHNNSPRTNAQTSVVDTASGAIQSGVDMQAHALDENAFIADYA